MGLRELLEELEHPPSDCDIMDVDKLLRRCDCNVVEHADTDTLVYSKPEWDLIWTWPRTKRTVPVSRLARLLEVVRWRLEQEGKI